MSRFTRRIRRTFFLFFKITEMSKGETPQRGQKDKMKIGGRTEE